MRIDKILAIHKEIDRVDIIGQAVLFESGIYAKLPEDMSEALALAALDVAGAPAHVSSPRPATAFSSSVQTASPAFSAATKL